MTTLSATRGDGCQRGESHSQPEATPQPSYVTVFERANAPPYSVPVAAPPPHGPYYAPQWSAPALHSSVHDQHYGVPYANDAACSYSVWPDAQHHRHASYAPAMSAAAQHKDQNQDTGYANGAAAYHQNNSIPTGSKDLHGRLSIGLQPGNAIEYGQTPGTSGAHSGAEADAQPYSTNVGAEAPVISEGLRSFARRYVLDQGTRVDTVHIESSGYGRLKVTITLEAADGI